jgi:NAD(P)-dependent dehydrogenase (short-subunit alcohol dehydrogenase family)
MQGKRAIVISATSDIGTAMCERWLRSGWEITGTFRTESVALESLKREGCKLVHCDVSDADSIRTACVKLRQECPAWDVLVLCPGAQHPVGMFVECDFDEWESSIGVNFLGQLRIVHLLIGSRNQNSHLGPLVLFFAGCGTNSAPVRYSAYTISKIALIKMTELLDAELPDVRFAIVGPGWVRTKIHQTTLDAGARAGDNYAKTQLKLAGCEMTPMTDVLDCCDWVVSSPRDVVGGRNVSVVFDAWGRKDLESALRNSPEMYKLRRCGNETMIRGKTP